MKTALVVAGTAIAVVLGVHFLMPQTGGTNHAANAPPGSNRAGPGGATAAGGSTSSDVKNYADAAKAGAEAAKVIVGLFSSDDDAPEEDGTEL